ncbi:GNAT family N-acetyltransferase [Smaragdicoccus niigatensis]|uniref:GNAT family N-acetyltransferase n=1 Tax=Smaragdicoccus niigatensis TaxID=359359 RepID=UPI0003642B22|nr:GNAT family N-acetyltransferase [Smaragdicoccus niigatensis]
MSNHVLDNPTWHSLIGKHRHLSARAGKAIRYLPEVSIFGGVEDWNDPAAWADVSSLTSSLALIGEELTLPTDWEFAWRGVGVQMTETDSFAPYFDDAAVVLTDADVPEMLDLVARTQPGPFSKHTNRLGTYLGFRSEGRLVAMAGERMAPEGWTEISAVCTDPDFRGRGYAERLVMSVASVIRERGDRSYLHAVDSNVGAIRLYERLGFEVRRAVTFSSVRKAR